MRGIISFIRSHIDHILLILALLVLLAGLFRLGGKKAIAAVTAPTLVFTQWWQDEIEKEALESLVAEFEALHPEIRIELRRLPYEEFRLRLFAPPAAGAAAVEASGAGELGDVLALDPLWGAGLEDREILASPETPILGFFCPLFYNIEILKAAGFSRPPKTRNEFLSCVRKVTDPNAGVYGIAMALGPGNYRGIYRDIYSWRWASSPEKTGETLEFLAALGRENLIYPGFLETGEEKKREAFVNGGAAFIIAPVQDTEIFRRLMGDEAFGFTSIPTPESHSGKPAFGAFGWGLGISRQSRYKEEAGVFVSFLAERGSFLAERLHAVPGAGSNPSPEVQSRIQADPFYSKAWDLYIAGDFIRDLPETEPSAAAIQRQWEELLKVNSNK
jgi:multiple sugar transport system substrate-binding protein